MVICTYIDENLVFFRIEELLCFFLVLGEWLTISENRTFGGSTSENLSAVRIPYFDIFSAFWLVSLILLLFLEGLLLDVMYFNLLKSLFGDRSIDVCYLWLGINPTYFSMTWLSVRISYFIIDLKKSNKGTK